MKKKTNKPYIIWLAILTLLTIVALVRSFYNDAPLSLDFAALLVGILAALCTVLIGWQIYTLIDLRHYKKLSEQLRKDFDHNLHEVYISLHSQLGSSFKSIVLSSANDFRKTEYLVLYNYLELFIHKLSIEDYVNLDDEIRLMFNDLKKRTPLELTLDEYQIIEDQIATFIVRCKKCHYIPCKPFRDIFQYISLRTSP